VHALGQVASFRTAASIPCDGFRRGLNSLLPPSIAVVAAADAEPDFHARFSAAGKHYRYSVLTRSSRSPLERRRAWHHPRPLDLAAMREAAHHLVGERDFSALRAAGCTARTAVRRLDQVALREPAPGRLELDVLGNAFLRNMVRILVGTLVEVGEGRLTPAEVAEIMESRDRTRAGQTAPAHGLCLVEVLYARQAG
jgi:tRNA pseudouridine38-40 synthase